MKKLVLIVTAIVLLAGIFSSCSNHLCPAYACNDQNEQVEINN